MAAELGKGGHEASVSGIPGPVGPKGVSLGPEEAGGVPYILGDSPAGPAQPPDLSRKPTFDSPPLAEERSRGRHVPTSNTSDVSVDLGADVETGVPPATKPLKARGEETEPTGSPRSRAGESGADHQDAASATPFAVDDVSDEPHSHHHRRTIPVDPREIAILGDEPDPENVEDIVIERALEREAIAAVANAELSPEQKTVLRGVLHGVRWGEIATQLRASGSQLSPLEMLALEDRTIEDIQNAFFDSPKPEALQRQRQAVVQRMLVTTGDVDRQDIEAKHGADSATIDSDIALVTDRITLDLAASVTGAAWEDIPSEGTVDERIAAMVAGMDPQEHRAAYTRLALTHMETHKKSNAVLAELAGLSGRTAAEGDNPDFRRQMIPLVRKLSQLKFSEKIAGSVLEPMLQRIHSEKNEVLDEERRGAVGRMLVESGTVNNQVIELGYGASEQTIDNDIELVSGNIAEDLAVSVTGAAQADIPSEGTADDKIAVMVESMDPQRLRTEYAQLAATQRETRQQRYAVLDELAGIAGRRVTEGDTLDLEEQRRPLERTLSRLRFSEGIADRVLAPMTQRVLSEVVAITDERQHDPHAIVHGSGKHFSRDGITAVTASTSVDPRANVSHELAIAPSGVPRTVSLARETRMVYDEASGEIRHDTSTQQRWEETVTARRLLADRRARADETGNQVNMAEEAEKVQVEAIVASAKAKREGASQAVSRASESEVLYLLREAKGELDHPGVAAIEIPEQIHFRGPPRPEVVAAFRDMARVLSEQRVTRTIIEDTGHRRESFFTITEDGELRSVEYTRNVPDEEPVSVRITQHDNELRAEQLLTADADTEVAEIYRPADETTIADLLEFLERRE